MDTHERKEAFLEELARTGSATAAAKAAGVSRVAAYQWRKSDLDFAGLWDRTAAACRRRSRRSPLRYARVVLLRDESGEPVLDAELEHALALDVSGVDPKVLASLIGRPLHR